MSRWFLTLFLLCALCLGMGNRVYAQNVPVSLPDVGGELGSPISIPLTVDQNVDGQNIFSSDFTISFDPAIVTLTTGENDGTLTSDCTVNVTPTDGQIDVGIACTSALEGGPGTILFLEGTLDGAGVSDLTFDEFMFNDTNVSSTTNGSVTVVAGEPPNANDDSATTPRNTPIDLSVLSNDNDPEGGALTITEVSVPSNGTAEIISSGTQIRYTPPADFSGVVTFTYTIEDPVGNVDMATVTVNVNNAPTADNDTAVTNEDASVVINVLDGDTDIDGTLNPASVTVTGSPANGATSVNPGNGNVTYIPNSDFNGGDSFTYTVRDDDGAVSNTATVTITVNPQNDAPQVANPLNDIELTENGDPFTANLDVVFNDPDGDPLTYDAASSDAGVAEASLDGGTAGLKAESSDPSVASASFQGSTLVVTPLSPGQATITVTATDAGAASDQDQFLTTVNSAGGNLAPIVVNPIPDLDFMGDDPPFTIDLNTVFQDPEGGPLTFSSTSTNRVAADPSIDASMLTVTPRGDGTSFVSITAFDAEGASARDEFTVNATDIVVQTETYIAILSGANEVPANASAGTGAITAILDNMTLSVSGTFENLSSPFDPTVGGGAHLHGGLFGQNGSVALPLVATVATDGLQGAFEEVNNTFELTQDQLEALEARGLYVNIHTEGAPAGEIRGQLLPDIALGKQVDEALFRAIFSGRAEIPANNSQAVGGVLAEFRDGTLIVSGAFSDLDSDFNPAIGGGAHIHQANIDENGGVVIPITATLDPNDDTRGIFSADLNTFALDDAQTTALFDGELYVNIHTDDLNAGELRGQILPVTHRVFEAYLSGANESPAVPSPGSGGVLAVYDEIDGTLMVSGSFMNLSSPFAAQIGAHLHEADAANNGGVVQALTVDLDADAVGGAFRGNENFFNPPASLVQALFEGTLYVNVHSDDNNPGELRGQLLPSTNLSPNPSIITSPTDGSAFDLGGNPTMAFGATWTEADDPNGNPVFYRWQLALDAGFNSVVFEANTEDVTGLASTFGEVDAILAANGVASGATITLFHRVVSTDGSFQTASQGASVSLTRDTGTADEDVETLPDQFVLRGNYPNPFNPSTTVSFDLPEAASVQVEVLDLLGRQLMLLPARSFSSGTGHTIQIEAGALATGTYLYRVIAESATQTHAAVGRMILIK